MKYLSIEEVLAIHKMVMEVGGGLQGVRDWHGLVSALEQPKQHVFTTDLYPSLASKAAIMLLIMIQYHPFVDGNKRTAFFSMLRFINKNGHELAIADQTALRLVVETAKNELSKEEIEKQLAAMLSAA